MRNSSIQVGKSKNDVDQLLKLIDEIKKECAQIDESKADQRKIVGNLLAEKESKTYEDVVREVNNSSEPSNSKKYYYSLSGKVFEEEILQGKISYTLWGEDYKVLVSFSITDKGGFLSSKEIEIGAVILTLKNNLESQLQLYNRKNQENKAKAVKPQEKSPIPPSVESFINNFTNDPRHHRFVEFLKIKLQDKSLPVPPKNPDNNRVSANTQEEAVTQNTIPFPPAPPSVQSSTSNISEQSAKLPESLIKDLPVPPTVNQINNPGNNIVSANTQEEKVTQNTTLVSVSVNPLEQQSQPTINSTFPQDEKRSELENAIEVQIYKAEERNEDGLTDGESTDGESTDGESTDGESTDGDEEEKKFFINQPDEVGKRYNLVTQELQAGNDPQETPRGNEQLNVYYSKELFESLNSAFPNFQEMEAGQDLLSGDNKISYLGYNAYLVSLPGIGSEVYIMVNDAHAAVFANDNAQDFIGIEDAEGSKFLINLLQEELEKEKQIGENNPNSLDEDYKDKLQEMESAVHNLEEKFELINDAAEEQEDESESDVTAVADPLNENNRSEEEERQKISVGQNKDKVLAELLDQAQDSNTKLEEHEVEVSYDQHIHVEKGEGLFAEDRELVNKKPSIVSDSSTYSTTDKAMLLSLDQSAKDARMKSSNRSHAKKPLVYSSDEDGEFLDMADIYLDRVHSPDYIPMLDVRAGDKDGAKVASNPLRTGKNLKKIVDSFEDFKKKNEDHKGFALAAHEECLKSLEASMALIIDLYFGEDETKYLKWNEDVSSLRIKLEQEQGSKKLSDDFIKDILESQLGLTVAYCKRDGIELGDLKVENLSSLEEVRDVLNQVRSLAEKQNNDQAEEPLVYSNDEDDEFLDMADIYLDRVHSPDYIPMLDVRAGYEDGAKVASNPLRTGKNLEKTLDAFEKYKKDLGVGRYDLTRKESSENNKTKISTPPSSIVSSESVVDEVPSNSLNTIPETFPNLHGISESGKNVKVGSNESVVVEDQQKNSILGKRKLSDKESAESKRRAIDPEFQFSNPEFSIGSKLAVKKSRVLKSNYEAAPFEEQFPEKDRNSMAVGNNYLIDQVNPLRVKEKWLKKAGQEEAKKEVLQSVKAQNKNPTNSVSSVVSEEDKISETSDAPSISPSSPCAQRLTEIPRVEKRNFSKTDPIQTIKETRFYFSNATKKPLFFRATSLNSKSKLTLITQEMDDQRFRVVTNNVEISHKQQVEEKMYGLIVSSYLEACKKVAGSVSEVAENQPAELTDEQKIEVGKFALIAIKNQGVNNVREDVIKQDLVSLFDLNDAQEDELEKKLNLIKKFSAIFQNNANQQQIYTGNQNAQSLAGMRLKRISPDFIKDKFISVALNENFEAGLTKVLEAKIDPIEVEEEEEELSL